MKRYTFVVSTLVLLFVSTLAFGQARVQVIHAAPFAENVEDTAVDITANGADFLFGVEYKQFTAYQPVQPDTYDIAVTPVGADEPAIEDTITLEDGVDYTILAVGDGVNQELRLIALVDDPETPAADNLNLRVIHAAPFADSPEGTEVSIRLAAGDVINGLVGVPFGADSGFFEIPAANYDLKVASNDGSTNFIDALPADLPPGVDISLVAIGGANSQPLSILAVVRGTTDIGELETRTPVDQSVNGWWTSANAADEGLALLPIPATNRLVGSIYTYAADDSGDQSWFVLDSGEGGFDGREAMGTLFTASGATLAGDESGTTEEAGTFGIEFLSCSEAVITAMLDDGAEATWTLNRLVQTVECNLSDQTE